MPLPPILHPQRSHFNTYLDNFFSVDNECVPDTWLCDKNIDCRDQSDEDPMRCKRENNRKQQKRPPNRGQIRECRSNEFHCGDAMCIPLKWKCDRHIDCPGGEDENLTTCSASINFEATGNPHPIYAIKSTSERPQPRSPCNGISYDLICL